MECLDYLKVLILKINERHKETIKLFKKEKRLANLGKIFRLFFFFWGGGGYKKTPLQFFDKMVSMLTTKFSIF